MLPFKFFFPIFKFELGILGEPHKTINVILIELDHEGVSGREEQSCPGPTHRGPMVEALCGGGGGGGGGGGARGRMNKARDPFADSFRRPTAGIRLLLNNTKLGRETNMDKKRKIETVERMKRI